MTTPSDLLRWFHVTQGWFTCHNKAWEWVNMQVHPDDNRLRIYALQPAYGCWKITVSC